ncbi:FdhF/YdeP family oxidoreductase [Muricoccus pecuniae]|uniref:Molybdopterin-dependent oxidoreductase alpha subunit n=1 Tax=Muricoccus pecuniae TaxID=693023 RepID=A0A840YAG4_9PROT|nr:FdhF/YdeP family oxidoreductase [Roseomonas pecuniae]MBB5693347.1 molybdopterin-dependent oxidoreductase alpha subunit [Roseomonas pecuniae]
MAKRPVSTKPYSGPAGGWGSFRSVESILLQEERIATGNAVLLKQNKPGGYSCVSCSWAKPREPLPFEYCENGAKATAWEITRKRLPDDFFETHTLTELLSWSDHDLEAIGRLTRPMRLDRARDRWVPVAWEDAFREIGAELRGMDPRRTIFYASGRASLETSYIYGLFARLYGHNNLPDSSNMCHESTSVALPQAIGAPVGTVQLEDFRDTACILSFGQNVGSNSPRMLHPLQEAAKRDVPIITFNPLKERGWERFTNPQSPQEMLTLKETRISSQYHQLRAGGDIAAITGMCKALVEADDKAMAAGRAPILDHAFIQQHTHGFDSFAAWCRAQDWAELERWSGLARQAMMDAASVYGAARSAIGIYGMGLTQHKKGVENVRMLVNLLLLRGNIGKPGAGILPVRGHSNVQGQRTVGITEKPELVPMDGLAEQYGFEPPRDTGMNTVEACEAILEGRVQAFLGLGGNFLRAVPETQRMEAAWPGIRLTVQVATKLNRNHLINGEVAYLLPCLGRLEVDAQAGGEQAVTCEDTMTHIHASRGTVAPASPHLLSEPAIVAGIAKATLPPNPRVTWDEWMGDYGRIRDAIEASYPEIFKDFNRRMDEPGGFARPLAARQREWQTETGKANFLVPAGFRTDLGTDLDDPEILQLITLRSNDQFNTTIYGYDDRFRGISGTREVLLMNRADASRLGLKEGDTVSLTTAVDDNVLRQVHGLRVVPYDIPQGAVGGYYPECNPLIPLWHYAEGSKVPAAKSVPVRIRRQEARMAAE